MKQQTNQLLRKIIREELKKVNEGSSDFVAKYDSTNIIIKHGYKSYSDDELGIIYEAYGKVMSNLRRTENYSIAPTKITIEF
jgi:methyl-accepting chemotaxis protein